MIRVRAVAAVWALVLFVSGVTTARADAKVDSPRYQAWSKFKVGSSHTLASTVNGGAVPMQREMKQTLLELTDDHATVETTSTMTVMGQEHPSPPRREDI